MNGPKKPATQVSAAARRRRELYCLRRLVDDRATHWHWQFMEHTLGPNQDYLRAEYAKGMADAYADLMNALSLMRGFPWA